METNIIFYILSGLLLLTGALVAFRPRPIESALWLILHFFLTSALYVILGAHFAAVVQILVYAGAILVLITFVILLLNLDPQEQGVSTTTPWTSFVLFVGTLATIFLCLHIASPQLLEKMPALEASSGFGSVELFSRLLLTKYLWAFEMAGVLLLLALIGVGMLSYRKAKLLKEGTS